MLGLLALRATVVPTDGLITLERDHHREIGLTRAQVEKLTDSSLDFTEAGSMIFAALASTTGELERTLRPGRQLTDDDLAELNTLGDAYKTQTILLVQLYVDSVIRGNALLREEQLPLCQT
ncbi:hypothetical protein ThrDRAFT_02824 [Frankia casuarinae]|jgi:hypothetical protein|uniref:Uncharacterized protein n=1 Tax=Frankia casuarinae (strain DSM 45818 / CECT 9043 / HFP020203 / CcI3) TaxID=106370 RepID=Q2J7S4_FRACC|nr:MULTISPECIES: hypothetical protein [Frankia]ABD12668.1 hypothetical protein Francci3_3311 [Frankia casuarinae]EYT91489.1 hypothetical protein ThrDRAFT_02824 [Frankia casuarinae]KDA41222.1 hypothetical protein BMG523Draft_03956 [Frankia sp. BMG5.23]TFE27391.1 hypothetical protein E0F15_16400 [Frankia sp. B2]